jgi:hypothetical protein
VNLTFRDKGSNLIPQIYLDNVKYGSVIVTTNTPKRLATPNCRLQNLNPYLCSQSNCIIKLACGDDVGFVSLQALATKANQPVIVRISICAGKSEDTLRFTNVARNFNLPPSGFEIITLGALTSTPSSLIFRYVPLDPPTGKATITINQGTCSSCGGFSRTKTCAGPCQLVIHPWELPKNYLSTEWVMYINNENAFSLPYTLTATRAGFGSLINLTPNTSTQLEILNSTWGYARYVVGAPSYWNGLEVADIGLTFGGARPPTSQDHGITYAISTSPSLETPVKLLDLPYGGKLEALGKCCVAPQTFYILIFNPNPATPYIISVNPRYNQLSLHTNLPWVDNKASGTVLARPSDARPPAERQFGPVSYQAYVNFPGIATKDGLIPKGSYLRAYATRDRSVSRT